MNQQDIHNSAHDSIAPAEPRRSVRRLPVWVLIVAPIVALLVSNGDVLLLALSSREEREGELRVSLPIAIPISLLAGGVTVMFMLRLRREIDRRAATEVELRAALRNLEEALRSLTLALDRERLLRRELDHRVRNNLSALLGLVSLYQESHSSPASIVRSLRGRIVTLREVYGLMTESHIEGIELRDLLHTVVTATMGGVDTHRVRMDGPPIRLGTREGNALAMVTHELITNAVKHGALRVPDGSIDIRWHTESRNADKLMRLRWRESPIPPRAGDTAEKGSQIGLSLIQGFVTSDLRGRVDFPKEPGCWNVEIVATLGPSADLSTPGMDRANASAPAQVP
jgi:two-component sensor histidine kinase